MTMKRNKQKKNEVKNNSSHNINSKNLRKPYKKLSASRIKQSKKYFQKIHERNQQRKCRFFRMGKCDLDDCQYSHDLNPEDIIRWDEPCKYYANNDCSKGNMCNYMHEKWPCLFFHQILNNKKCKYGDECRFSHEPLNDVIKAALEKWLEKDALKSNKNDIESHNEVATCTIESFGQSVLVNSNNRDSIPLHTSVEMVEDNSKELISNFGSVSLISNRNINKMESQNSHLISNNNETETYLNLNKFSEEGENDNINSSLTFQGFGKISWLSQSIDDNVDKKECLEEKTEINKINEISTNFLLKHVPTYIPFTDELSDDEHLELNKKEKEQKNLKNNLQEQEIKNDIKICDNLKEVRETEQKNEEKPEISKKEKEQIYCKEIQLNNNFQEKSNEETLINKKAIQFDVKNKNQEINKKGKIKRQNTKRKIKNNKLKNKNQIIKQEKLRQYKDRIKELLGINDDSISSEISEASENNNKNNNNKNNNNKNNNNNNRKKLKVKNNKSNIDNKKINDISYIPLDVVNIEFDYDEEELDDKKLVNLDALYCEEDDDVDYVNKVKKSFEINLDCVNIEGLDESFYDEYDEKEMRKTFVWNQPILLEYELFKGYKSMDINCFHLPHKFEDPRLKSHPNTLKNKNWNWFK